jgi:hypothetical protein
MAIQYAEGRYWVRVVSQETGESKEKGTPYFRLRVAILGPVSQDNPDAYDSCPHGERSVTFWFAPKTTERIIEDLQSIGFDKPSFKFLEPFNSGHHDFTNVEFVAYCKHSDYKGGSEEWNLSGERPRSEPLAPEKFRELDSLFGSALKAKAKKPATKPAAATASVPLTDPNLDLAAAAAEASESDIPF